MTPEAMLQTLQRWREAGWLRPLDLAFARFVHEQAPATPPGLLLAAALVAHLEGRGHGCLPLQTLQAEAAGLLGWPAPALAELGAALAALPGSIAALDAAAQPAVHVGPTPGSAPLVLHEGRLYLRRYFGYEQRVASQVLRRCAAPGTRHDTDPAFVHRWMDRLFPHDAGVAADPQRLACALALQGSLTIVTGGPGTGKTYTAARLLVLLQALHRGPQPLRAALAAPTGKAAARLRQSIELALQYLQQRLGDTLPVAALAPPPARTLHALLGTVPGTRRLRHDATHPLDLDLLFVDEASMVHLEMMALLLEALPPRACVVLLGDKDQLASVETGAVLGDLCAAAVGAYRLDTAAWVQAATGQALAPAQVGHGSDLAQQTVVLRTSRRFQGPIAELAGAVNAGDGAATEQLLRSDDTGVLAWQAATDPGAVASLAVQGRSEQAAGYARYLARLDQRPADAAAFEPWARQLLRDYDALRVLCALRDGPLGVAGLNAAIEQALAVAGWLPQRRAEWYEGRPVMVTRNEPALGVYNGDIGVVLRSPGGSLRVWFLEGGGLRSVATSRLADVQTAYAMTVHKSQGSEFGHVVLVLPPEAHAVLTRELVYTGLTRARDAFTLAGGDSAVLAEALARVVRRASGLQAALQHPQGRASP
jgi:exodeoxyribonuclease V alpha subunit